MKNKKALSEIIITLVIILLILTAIIILLVGVKKIPKNQTNDTIIPKINTTPKNITPPSSGNFELGISFPPLANQQQIDFSIEHLNELGINKIRIGSKASIIITSHILPHFKG